MATLLHIITGLNTGGAERSLHSLLVGGLAARHACHVVSLTDAGAFGPKIAALGVPVHCLGMSPGRPSLRALMQLRKIIRTASPDVIQGWMYHGNLAASFARLMAGGPPSTRAALVWNICHSLHDLSNEKRGTRVVIRLGQWLSHHPSGIVYNGHISRAHHQAFGYHSAHSAVIANGFDTQQWGGDFSAREKMRAALRLGADDMLIGFVGRYHPIKDIPNFLIAMAGLMHAHPHVQCAIVGQDVGPENPALAPYFAALPPDRLHVFGRRDDVAALMPGFDLLCLSSRSEASPMVLGEAMACAVPCVATDVGDARHIIGDTGRIVAPSDPAALHQALTDMLHLGAPQRAALGAAARARICADFSLAATVRGYLSLYESLLKGHA